MSIGSRTLLLAGVCLSLLSARALSAEEAKTPEKFALTVGRAYTLAGEKHDGVLDAATILVDKGKIIAVGRDVKVPDGVRHFRLPSHTLIPGLIDAETTLTADNRDVIRSVAPDVRALDAWDFLAERKSLLRGGVTCVYASPGVATQGSRSTRLISGRGAVVKTAGNKANPLARVVAEASGVQVTLGAVSRSQPSIYDPPIGATSDNPFEVLDIVLPQSRAGQFLALRQVFDDAKNFATQVNAALEKSAALPEWDITNGSLYPLVQGEDYLRVRATKAHDVYRMIDLAKKRGMRVVLESDAEVLKVSSLLKENGIPVIFPGAFRPGRISTGDLDVELVGGESDENAVLALAQSGVSVVINSPSDSDVKDLLLQAATAVGLGMSPVEALRAITATPAEIMGVDDRIGSIEVGKDADFVLLGGEPFEVGSDPQAVLIDGQIVYQDAPEIDKDSTVVRCGRILDGRGGTIEGGLIVIKEKKITYVGPGALFDDLSKAGKVIDAHDRTVVPGLIDTGSVVGTRAETLAPTVAAPSGSQGGVSSAAYRLADSIKPGDPALLELASSGITTVLITPPVAGSISGQVSAVKLAGATRDDMMLKEYAALLFGSTSTTTLKKAKAYVDGLKKYEAQKAALEKKGDKKALAALKAPTPIEIYDPIRDVFEGKVPAILPLTSASSLESALKSLKQTYGVRALVYRLKPSRIADYDAGSSALRTVSSGLLIDAPFIVPGEARKPAVNVAREWAKRGVSISFRSLGATGGRFLPLQVAYAVRQGLSADDALSAMTYNAAKQFGIEERVGSIEKGKDADLVFLSGEPFALTTQVRAVMINGDMVVEEDK